MYDRTKLNAELSRDEGVESMAYKDIMGIWSVGKGRNLEAHGLPIEILVDVIERAGGLTLTEIDAVCDVDILEAESVLNSLYHGWRDISDVRQRVLLNMSFNMGPTVFAKFVKFWAAVHRQDWMEAGREMEDSAWWGQVGPRAERLRKMIEEG